jgi:hypothetical protein
MQLAKTQSVQTVRPQINLTSNTVKSEQPTHFQPDHVASSRGSDFGDAAKIMITKLGPAAAITGAAATYAYQASGLGLASAALIGVPIAAAGITTFAESLNIGGGPNYGGAKGLNSIIVGGAGFAGGVVGALVGSHFGSVGVGALAGGLAPAAITAALLGGAALFH